MNNEGISPFSEAKGFLHADAIRHLIRGKLPPPVTIEVDLTDGFYNQKCRHCFFSTPNKESPIYFPVSRALDVANEIKKLGARAIEFPGGGEPTTHPDFDRIIKAFASVGLPMGIVTNGLLSKRIVPLINQFKWIRISLDAGNETDYSRVHGTNDFYEVIDGIRNMVNAKSHTIIGIGFLLMPENWKSAYSVVSLANSIGVDYLQFRPASKVAWPSKEDQETARISIERLKSENTQLAIFTSQHKWKRIEYGRSFPFCQTSALVGIIKANGEIPFCCLKRDDPKMVLGNIFEESFETIWYGKEHQNLFKDQSHKDCPIPCKHDAYNDIYYALKDDTVDENFL